MTSDAEGDGLGARGAGDQHRRREWNRHGELVQAER